VESDADGALSGLSPKAKRAVQVRLGQLDAFRIDDDRTAPKPRPTHIQLPGGAIVEVAQPRAIDDDDAIPF
jgi:hypothetical protein